MATPIISTLRRNQGYVLAVMGVVLIITWVIGPAALDFMSGGGGNGNRGRDTRDRPVVVQWTKGSTTQSLTEADIEQLRQEHRAVLEFVHRVVNAAVDKKFIPQAPGLDLTPNARGQIQLGLPMDDSEATVVNIMLFAERGREMGVRVDKDAMVHYLKNLSGFSMEQGDFVELAQETVDQATKSNQLISVDGLFAALRKELVSQQARFMLLGLGSSISTGELWEYHKQLNLRYKIEAYPVDVEKLKVDFKAADAKPEELLALFEKGKGLAPNPERPEPGFRIPHRISFGYCTVDFEPFLQQAKKNVPEEKALETYKTGVNQGRFRKVTLPGLPDETKPAEVKPGETKPDEKPAGDGEKKPSDETEKKKPPKAEDPKATEEKPAEKPTEKAEEEPAKPANEKPADEKKEEKSAEEKPPQVAAICEEEPAKAAEAEEAKLAEDKPAEEKKDEEKPAGEKVPAKEEIKTDPEKPATTPPPAAETPPGEKTEDPAKKPKAEEVKHKTYQEARDEILTELAQPEAVILRDEAIRNAMDELRIYSTKRQRYEENKKAATTSAPVAVENPGDFHPIAFAAKYKFIFGKTNLMDQYEVQNTELGRSAVLRGQRGSLAFSQFAYLPAKLYDPHDVDSAFSDTRYIYWRISDEPEQGVALEKDGSLPPAVKEKVEEAWLTEKAYEAAKKRAEELAAKAKATSLKDLVGKTEAIKVVEPFPFSMFTTNGVPLYYPAPYTGQVEFSQPVGVPLAGKEFMDAVFSLKPGEAGIAPDQPHKVVYAVRVLGEEPSLEIRREMFLSTLQRGRMSDLMAFSNMERGRENQGLFDDLEKHFRVKWLRAVNFGDGGE